MIDQVISWGHMTEGKDAQNAQELVKQQGRKTMFQEKTQQVQEEVRLNKDDEA